MAETVITSAASSVISSTINSLSTLAWDEIKFLKDVPEKVKLIQAKLILIQSYLKDAEYKPQKRHLTTYWLSELKGVTYRAQDVIEKIQWLQQRRNRARGFTGAFSRYIHIPGYLKSLHQIGAEIDQINNFIPGISDMVNNLNAVDLGESSSTTDQFENQQLEDPRRAICINEEDEVIGFESEMREIIKELLDPGYKPLSVVSLVGMGGIGKTTLAKKVSNHSEVKNNFDIIVSITVSKDYNVLNLQKEILKVVAPISNGDLEKMTELGEVREKLSCALKEKKYLIVIDDIWQPGFWDEINFGNTTFPDVNNGSRIMLTTRNLNVANYPGLKKYLHEVKRLDYEKSRELLMKKAFPPYETVSDPIRNELESLGSKLVEKCNGLPLALVVLGGYLSKHLDYQTWSRMVDAIDWSEAGNQINISQILALSYHDLPNHLKPAFLYITTFPEDYIIECSDLIRLWIAEGFVPPKLTCKMEKTAQCYVDQLYELGLIQVVERSIVGRWISKIRIHDVLRDWGMERVREDGFFHVIKNSDHVKHFDPHTPFRVALHGYCDKDIATTMPSLRTLLGVELQEKDVFHGLKLLRVLYLTHTNVDTSKSWKLNINHMIYLRYICIQNCSEVYFPSSMGELGNLQTLECKKSYVMSLPSSLWQISTLRHVHLDLIWCNWNGPKKGSGKNLQTLVVHQSDGNDALLKEGTTWMYTGMNGVAVAVKEMEQIVKLELDTLHSLHKNMLSNTCGLRYLEELVLWNPINGMTRLPTASVFLPSILKLQLYCNELVEDPMPVLQGLPKLADLKLLSGYQLKSMRCSTKGFPRLKYLFLGTFKALKDWTVDVGAMPYLCELKLSYIDNLKEFPEGLMEHDQLQLLELNLVRHSDKFDCSKLKENGCKVEIR